MRIKSDAGIALISTLLVLVLLGILLEGFILSVNSEQEAIGIDRGQTQSFYAALAGLEKLTADLGSLIDVNYKPTTSQINQLITQPPSIPMVTYDSPDGMGYMIVKKNEAIRNIPSGPYEGLVGIMTPYTMTTTAQAFGSAEVKMKRDLQVVLIPVFQFGIFSETDLSFFAGPDFDFGGRVHSNGHIFLAEGSSRTLKLNKRITAVGEIIRTHLSNGWSTNSGYTGNVTIKTSAGTNRNLARDEGSLVGTLGSASNPDWEDISKNQYGGSIRNWVTGARRMDLPLVDNGAKPIDIIKRPVAGEEASNPEVLVQRNFDFASMRILLSDTDGEILSLPYIDNSASPVHLSGALSSGEAIAQSPGAVWPFMGTGSLIDGCIKIEIQTAPKIWQDVTAEILGLGVSGNDLAANSPTYHYCSCSAPDSIIRIQRHKDVAGSHECDNSVSDGTKFWPNVLYDTREGALRGTVSKTQYNVYLGGVMHYVELDVNNLARWFLGLTGSGTGTNAIHDTGYVVYFSDRRTNKNGFGQETGEYGFEDIVNSGDSYYGTPDNTLEAAEDVNGNDQLDVYGKTFIPPPDSTWTGDTSPTKLVDAAVARQNRAVLFRRALKVVNGDPINLGTDTDGIPYGLSIAAENPIYVQGDYNEDDQNFDTGWHVASSIIGDAVTLLSNNWNDRYSFHCPHTTSATCGYGLTGRKASTTWYRMAIISGKGKSFDHPDGRYQDFGTDGGVHNFLRFIENWGSQTLNYRGSIVSLYYNRQGIGTYKCGDNDIVYQPPSRGYKFDEEFLDPKLLPPHTPLFKDINITGFTQMKMPNQ